ncbi:MAG: DUF4384 domain-containing protein [Bacteroidota bacterium]
MNRQIWVILSCITVVFSCFADIPDWVKNQGRSARFPDELYITGFGMAKLEDNDKAKCQKLSEDNAKANLVQKVRVTIQSTVVSQAEEKSGKYAEYFSSAVQSSSTLSLRGLDILSYYDDDAEMCYSFAYAEREKIFSLYEAKEKECRDIVQQHLQSGAAYEKSKERGKAIAEYLACYPAFQQLEEAEAVCAAVQSSIDKAFAGLGKDVEEDQVRISRINQAIAALVQKPLESLDDLAWYLTYCLKEQIPSQRYKILVTPLTFRDTKMGSPFSRYFQHMFEPVVVSSAEWELVGDGAAADLIAVGTYWDEAGGLKFIMSLRNKADNRTVASVERFVPDSIIQRTNLDIKPQNFEQALSDQKQFRKDEVVGGGLLLDVWTSKGIENLLFTKGERMKVYVRVNIPSYIRFVYHLANGKRTLLLSNYYIDETKINKPVEIPEEFECDAPFGAEVLQVFARTEQFEPVATIQSDGYEILRDSLGTFVATTRGMKKATMGTLQAETRVTLTTVDQ